MIRRVCKLSETAHWYGWLVTGLVVMALIRVMPVEWLGVLVGLSSYLDWIPAVRSIDEATVFDRNMGKVHLAIMVCLIPIMSFGFFCLPEDGFVQARNDVGRVFVLALIPLLSSIVLLSTVLKNSHSLLFMFSMSFAFLSTFLAIISACSLRCIVALAKYFLSYRA